MSMAVPPDKTPAPSSLRAAATIVVVRDGDRGMEVLLLRRVERSGDRSSGAFVFPGGTLDAADRALHGCCAGMDDAEASRRLGVPEHGLDYYVAAVRECFEEAGLLFACDAGGQLANLRHAGEELAALRALLRDGGASLQALCGRLGLQLAVDRLAYHSHWLTPPGLPKRFDTRFFVAEAPSGQAASFDSLETLEHRWIRPADALDEANRLPLPNPTRHTLQSMAAFSSAHAFIEHTRQLSRIELIMPRMGHGERGDRPVMPFEPAYAEIARLDPEGRGRVSHELHARAPGAAVGARAARDGAQRQHDDRAGHQHLHRGRCARADVVRDRPGAREPHARARRSSPPRRGRSSRSSSPTRTATTPRRRPRCRPAPGRACSA